nr:hypothetical protein [Mesorhizobium norvegicum]
MKFSLGCLKTLCVDDDPDLGAAGTAIRAGMQGRAEIRVIIDAQSLQAAE